MNLNSVCYHGGKNGEILLKVFSLQPYFVALVKFVLLSDTHASHSASQLLTTS